MRLTDFRALTFDCYGTLIDWESGIYTALQPLLRKAAGPPERDAALQAFARHESAQQSVTPGMIYSELLATVHGRLAEEWGVPATGADHAAFGASVPDWPAFADSVSSLRYLKEHYQLVILSNVDRRSFEGSNKRLGVAFDAIYTAQDIGSYKPDAANFTYLLEHLKQRGLERADILHTAQSLFHDHGPAKQAHLATAWIDRRHEQHGWGATMPPPEGSGFDFRFNGMAEMVEAHRAELRV